MKSVLILGAAGFLGRYLVEACSNLNYRIYGVSRTASCLQGVFTAYITGDIETVDIDSLMKFSSIDYCFHFASSSSVGGSIVSPFSDFMGCLPGTARLLDIVRRNQPQCHVIFASSAAVYGNPVSLPISERSSTNPISPYGCHKLLAENLAKDYSRIYGLRISVMRIFSAYGPGQKKQLLWDACNKITSAIIARQKSVSFDGTGFETRDFIHAQDVASAALAIAQHNGSGYSLYNVASGYETSIKRIIEIISSSFEASVQIDFAGGPSFGVPSNWCADVSKLQSIGHTSVNNLDKSIHSYVQWARHTLNYPELS